MPRKLRYILPPLIMITVLSNSGIVSAQDKRTNDFQKCESLIKGCLYQIKKENFGKAGRILGLAFLTAQKLKEPFSRNMIFNEISDKFLRIGGNNRALEAAGKITFADVRESALSKISRSYLKGGDYEKALKVSTTIDGDFQRALTLYSLVNILIAEERYNEALEVAAVLKNSKALVHKLLLIQILSEESKRKELSVDSTAYIPDNPGLNEPFLTCLKKLDAAEKLFVLNLYSPADKILSEVVFLTPFISPVSLQEHIFRRSRGIRDKINNLEKRLISKKIKKYKK